MWQAGLLCLLATTHAVIVHQAPVYDNKLTPQTIYKPLPQPYSHPQPLQSHQSLTYPQPLTHRPLQNYQPLLQPVSNQPLLNHQHLLQPVSNHQPLLQPVSNHQPLLQPITNHQPLQYQPLLQPVSNHQPLLNHQQVLQPVSDHRPLLKPVNHQPLLQPVSNHLQPSSKEDYYDEPSYSFAYQIHDDLTGDQKSHTETRQGDVVQGSYSLIEPDGSRRIVDYVADKIGGFRAQVRREKGAAKPIVAKVPVYQPSYVPRAPKYQGPVTFTPAKYLLQPAPVTEQSKYTTATVKPYTVKPSYNPVVYATAASEDKARTAPGLFTNPNQISYKPVQYA